MMASVTQPPPAPVTMAPIGVVHSPFRQKLGTPRQPGLAPAAEGKLELVPPYGEGAEGLEAFSHVWLLFLFDRHLDRPASLRVRPPRLGGDTRVGVFASRAPYRPNPIGLSVVRLLAVDRHTDGGATLRVAGLDLVDGTPVLDVKPYVPYADAVPDAAAGWADGPPPHLPVRFAPDVEAALADRAELRALIEQTLRLDPRPAHARRVTERAWAVRLGEVDVRWVVDPAGVRVVGI